MDKAVKEYMSKLGKKSWEKRKGKQNMSEAGKLGAEKRWGKKTKPIATEKLDMPFTVE